MVEAARPEDADECRPLAVTARFVQESCRPIPSLSRILLSLRPILFIELSVSGPLFSGIDKA